MKPWFCTDCDAYLGDETRVGHRIREGVRSVGEADIFGPESKLVGHSEAVTAPPGPLSWIDSAAYEISVILIFTLLCHLLYTYRKNTTLLMKIFTRRTPVEKVYGEQTLAFKYFIRTSQLFAALLFCAIFIRLVVFIGIPTKVPLFSSLQVNLVVPTVLLAIGIAAIYRILVIQLIGGVTRNVPFFSRYRFVTRLFSAFTSLILAPFFLLCALYDGSLARVFIYLLIGLCGLILLTYLKLSGQFFIERKVSILQWILYLCAVEILPFSFLWFLWARNIA